MRFHFLGWGTSLDYTFFWCGNWQGWSLARRVYCEYSIESFNPINLRAWGFQILWSGSYLSPCFLLIALRVNGQGLAINL